MKKEENKLQTKINFVGGKLRLKSTKPENTILPTINKLKQVVAKEKKNLRNRERTYDEEIGGFLNEKEEAYIEALENNIDFEESYESPMSEKRTTEKGLMDDMTPAERVYYERKLNRLPEKIRKSLQTTYKQKYDTFNKTLSKLPTHYDIPKVGPG